MFHCLVGTGLSHHGNTSTAEKFDNIISLATRLKITVNDVYVLLSIIVSILYASHNIVDIGEFIFPYLLLLF